MHKKSQQKEKALFFFKEQNIYHISNNQMNEVSGCKYNNKGSRRNTILNKQKSTVMLCKSLIIFLPMSLTSSSRSIHFQAIFVFLLNLSLSSLLPGHFSGLLSWAVLLIFDETYLI